MEPRLEEDAATIVEEDSLPPIRWSRGENSRGIKFPEEGLKGACKKLGIKFPTTKGEIDRIVWDEYNRCVGCLLLLSIPFRMIKH